MPRKNSIKGNKLKKCIPIAFALIVVLFLSTNTSAFVQFLSLLINLKDVADELGAIMGRILVRIAYTWGVLRFSLVSKWLASCDHLQNLILVNPDLLIETQDGLVGNPPIENLVNAFIRIVHPFYFLAIALIGFYLLFLSGSPLGRARAKSSLIKLVISMGVIYLTLPIIQLVIDISEYITGTIFNLIDVTQGIAAMKAGIFGVWEISWIAMIFNYWNQIFIVMFMSVMFSAPFLYIGMRFFLILYFTALFPLSVFLYSFYFTRRVGEKMFKITFTWILTQPIMALVLAGVAVAAHSMPMMNDFSLRTSFGIAGFLALTIAPLMIGGIIDWLAMLMIILTTMEFPGLHGVIGTIDELQVEAPSSKEISPPPPIRPNSRI